jgi:hypothetical protein
VLLLPFVSALGLLVGLVVGGASAGAAGPDLSGQPRCEDLLHGPPKEVAATKVIDSVTMNADTSVRLAVTVSWSYAVPAKPGEKTFDCVWDGLPGQGPVVGSTGHPGADCSQQGLPCTFSVTTSPLGPGTHRLCDIAKILGTWAKPQRGPAPSGSRTNTVCVTVVEEGGGLGGGVVPPPSSPPTPTPPATENETSTPVPAASATAAPKANPAAVPGMPGTGHRPVGSVLLYGLVGAGGGGLLAGLGIAARLTRRRWLPRVTPRSG